MPRVSIKLRRLHKHVVDALVGDMGNYTQRYCQRFEELLNVGADRSIRVQTFDWSSQNNHIGRADAAVRLAGQLLDDADRGERHIVLWGHSHAGNVFALLSNLLASNDLRNEDFYRAAASFYGWPLTSVVDAPDWPRLADALNTRQETLRKLKLDIVTFGTPIRYGWDNSGFHQLLHFVNHAPRQSLPDYRTSFPVTLRRMFTAADGDYVQQWGMASTNLIPFPLALRAWCADWRLHRVLQSDVSRWSLWKRLSTGARVHHEGETLLVDYGPQERSVMRHLFGHAVYTRERWLPFHLVEVAHHWYGG